MDREKDRQCSIQIERKIDNVQYRQRERLIMINICIYRERQKLINIDREKDRHFQYRQRERQTLINVDRKKDRQCSIQIKIDRYKVPQRERKIEK